MHFSFKQLKEEFIAVVVLIPSNEQLHREDKHLHGYCVSNRMKTEELLIALLRLNCLRFLYYYSQCLTKIFRCQAAREKALVGNTLKLAKAGQFTMGVFLNHTLSIC